MLPQESLERGATAEAAAFARRAIAADPTCVACILSLAEIRAQEGQNAESLAATLGAEACWKTVRGRLAWNGCGADCTSPTRR